MHTAQDADDDNDDVHSALGRRYATMPSQPERSRRSEHYHVRDRT